MSDAHEYRVCVHYPGHDEPVWCDTIGEAITFINAENVGRGLPPVKGRFLTVLLAMLGQTGVEG